MASTPSNILQNGNGEFSDMYMNNGHVCMNGNGNDDGNGNGNGNTFLPPPTRYGLQYSNATANLAVDYRPRSMSCPTYTDGGLIASDSEDDEEGPVDESDGRDETEDNTNEDSDPEEWDSSDESETEALLDVYESRLLVPLDQKILDIEKLLDNPQFIFRSIVRVPSRLGKRRASPTPNKLMSDMSTQTETEDSLKTRDVLRLELDIAEESCGQLTEADKAREEIQHLRLSRDSLLTQRQELARKIKQQGALGDPKDERKLYEFEEAIAAIDCCIEFKNEIICGREFTFSNNLAPGLAESGIVSRMNKLSMLDLQRLVHTLYSKVVEFRYSTKKLEKQTEEFESKYVHAYRRCGRYKRQIRQLEEEFNGCVEEIMRYYSKDQTRSLSDYLHHSKTAKAARRRQHDLELCLTELLVRHDYLRNETDYDVKHIVEMLGIDPLKLKLHQMEEDDEEKKSVIPAALRIQLLQNEIPAGQVMSRRMREAHGHRRPPHSSSSRHVHGHGHGHSSGQGHEHGHPQPSTSSTAAYSQRERHHYKNGHVSDHHPNTSSSKHKPSKY